MSLPRVISCADVQAQGDQLNTAALATHAAVFSSGKMPAGWLSSWAAWLSEWNLFYTQTLPQCSVFNPLASHPAALRDQLNSYGNQLAQWQTEAEAAGVDIPGGVLPANQTEDTDAISNVAKTLTTLALVGGAVFIVTRFVK